MCGGASFTTANSGTECALLLGAVNPAVDGAASNVTEDGCTAFDELNLPEFSTRQVAVKTAFDAMTAGLAEDTPVDLVANMAAAAASQATLE